MNAAQKTEQKKVLSPIEARDQEIRKALLSSYGLMTAEKILLKLAIRVTPKVLKLIIRQGNTFYYQLLKIPTQILFNGIIYERAHDMQTLLQQRMVHYLYSDAANQEEGAPGGGYRANMEQIRLKLVDFNNDFKAFSEECDITERELLTNLRTKSLAWAELCDEISEKIAKQLEEEGKELPDYFRRDLSILMRQEALGIDLPKAALKNYPVDGAPNPIEKCVIYLLESIKEA